MAYPACRVVLLIEVRAASLFVLLHMRGDVEDTSCSDEVLRIVGLVRADRDAPRAALPSLGKQEQGGVAFGLAICLGRHRGRNQAVAVLHQRMAQIRGLRLLAKALLREPRLRIGGGPVRLVRSLLPTEVRAIAVVGTVLAAEALLRGPRLHPSEQARWGPRAWINVPSTVKCSSLRKRLATSEVTSRSRLFENTACVRLCASHGRLPRRLPGGGR